MGFMDKVKAQATVLAEKAQEGAKAGQAKLSDMQAKKHADALLLELGGLVYSEQAGRGSGRRRGEDCRAGRAACASSRPSTGRSTVTSATLHGAGVARTARSSRPRRPPATRPSRPRRPRRPTVAGGGGIPQSVGGIPTGTLRLRHRRASETETS